MPHFIDPSETRKGTKMPVDAQEIFIELPGLEERTGADFLLSSLQMPAANDALLRRHCEAGILVQRKSGLDLPSSIIDGRLSHSLGKMLEWCKRPWLLIVGNLTEQSGKVSVGGSPSNLTYGQVIAAVDWHLPVWSRTHHASDISPMLRSLAHRSSSMDYHRQIPCHLARSDCLQSATRDVCTIRASCLDYAKVCRR